VTAARSPGGRSRAREPGEGRGRGSRARGPRATRDPRVASREPQTPSRRPSASAAAQSARFSRADRWARSVRSSGPWSRRPHARLVTDAQQRRRQRPLVSCPTVPGWQIGQDTGAKSRGAGAGAKRAASRRLRPAARPPRPSRGRRPIGQILMGGPLGTVQSARVSPGAAGPRSAGDRRPVATASETLVSCPTVPGWQIGQNAGAKSGGEGEGARTPGRGARAPELCAGAVPD
jgi:hypothetical protein